ncbi:DUF1014-domain-containing protein [Phellopilus nigrolimitatus]|nr:DUF1014-domain-containing protein [Phellopilus nigrolimitatus]
MAPKGGNAKKESGRAKKAENEAKKRDAEAETKEKKVADEWSSGAKGKSAKEDKEAKRKEALALKAERERILAMEEAAIPSKPKPVQKAGAKKKAVDTRPAGPGAIAAGGGIASATAESGPDERPKEIEAFSATGIDDALDLMEVVNAKKDKASVGQQAAGLEKHPERRFKAAFEAYQERELPNIKNDHPGLRLNQYKDLLFKQFQKSSENPFNQTLVSYDASKDEKVEALQHRKKELEDRLRESRRT